MRTTRVFNKESWTVAEFAGHVGPPWAPKIWTWMTESESKNGQNGRENPGDIQQEPVTRPKREHHKCNVVARFGVCTRPNCPFVHPSPPPPSFPFPTSPLFHDFKNWASSYVEYKERERILLIELQEAKRGELQALYQLEWEWTFQGTSDDPDLATETTPPGSRPTSETTSMGREPANFRMPILHGLMMVGMFIMHHPCSPPIEGGNTNDLPVFIVVTESQWVWPGLNIWGFAQEPPLTNHASESRTIWTDNTVGYYHYRTLCTLHKSFLSPTYPVFLVLRIKTIRSSVTTGNVMWKWDLPGPCVQQPVTRNKWQPRQSWCTARTKPCATIC